MVNLCTSVVKLDDGVGWDAGHVPNLLILQNWDVLGRPTDSVIPFHHRRTKMDLTLVNYFVWQVHHSGKKTPITVPAPYLSVTSATRQISPNSPELRCLSPNPDRACENRQGLTKNGICENCLSKSQIVCGDVRCKNKSVFGVHRYKNKNIVV